MNFYFPGSSWQNQKVQLSQKIGELLTQNLSIYYITPMRIQYCNFGQILFLKKTWWKKTQIKMAKTQNQKIFKNKIAPDLKLRQRHQETKDNICPNF
jgi:hypothetical protein